ncbi:MAG: hypothetical protein IJG62_01845 [Synergistaceae bacterium]|nr:hypothetical protein [Synergistaceae bacterium]MBQ3625126.1 hypothetical protein [Synergistaceae bacterium]MBQ4419212.1 hypothetical protein [Synergistaceae bacterium]MBQ6739135.1 hypothetical protein [Synergistaceae bacterium]MBQ6908479.1 hypothetical protein [Synergistaceae bacterium]
MATATDIESVYVRQDVFNARMDRMEMLLEKTITEIKADNEKSRTELKAEIKMLDERINSVNARVDSVQTTVYWGFTVLTLFLALTTFAPALLEFIKGLRKPQLTAEDVQNMIDAAISKLPKLSS